MEFKTVDDVRKDLELKSQIKKAGEDAPDRFKNIQSTISQTFKNPGAGKISDISYTGGFGNVYERGMDGNYYAKYENYLGATGNEDRLGRTQGAGEQLWNGLVKNVSKAGLYAVESTVGTIVGLTNAIADGDMKSFWDNDFNDAMDYASKDLDRELPNYYTDEQKSANFFGKLFTANFLGNDFLHGMAFVAGAALPQLAIGALTGGTTLAPTLARLGGKIGYSTGRKFGTTSLRNSLRIGNSIGKGTGELLNTGKFIAQSTFFEAGMEARGNFHDSIDNWTKDYYKTYGAIPSNEEIEKYIGAAESGANGVFWGNVGLLSITNAAMFGKAFGLGKVTLPGTKAMNKFIGLGVETGEKGALKTLVPTTAQKLLGKAYFIGRKPVSEGLVEEGLQGVITKMADTYTKAKYEGDDSYSFVQNLTNALGKQYGTKEGWNEIGVGMLVGAVGGNVAGNFGFEGIGGGKNIETYSRTIKDIQEKVDKRNASVDTFRNLNRTNSMFNANLNTGAKNKEEDLQSTQLYQDVVANHSYIKANMPLKGMTDLAKDYNAVIDGLEITDDQLVESGLENIEDYKSLMKDQFQSDLKSFNKINSFVNNIDLKPIKLSDGNVVELSDALTLSLMAGEKADEQSKKIASNIEELTGVTGAHSALKFFEGLNSKQLSNIDKLRTQQENLAKLENELVKVQNSISENKATGENKEKIIQLSKKYAVVSQQIGNLNDSISSVKDTLNNEFNSIKASDLTINTDYSNIDDVIKTVDNIRGLVDGLKKTGRVQDAKKLENYLEQFSVFTQTALDSKAVQDSLVSSNFFKSKKGKKIISSIIGDEYKASPEAIEEIKGIEGDIINKASGLGYSVADTEEFLNRLETSTHLSDREKYRIEGIARTLATQKIILERANEVQDRFDSKVEDIIPLVDENAIENITVKSPNIVGDTVKTSSELKNANPTNSEQLKALVDEIASLNDQIVNKPTSYQLEELNKKRKQLENLNKELEVAKNNINNLNLQSHASNEVSSTTKISVGEQPQISQGVREGNAQGKEITQESQKEKIINLEKKRLDELDNFEKSSGYTDRYKEPQTEFKIKKEYTLDSIVDELVSDNKIFIRDGNPALKNTETTPKRIESFYKKIGLTKLVESISGLKFIDTSKLNKDEAKKYYLNILNTLRPFLKNVSIYEVEDSIENALNGNGLAFSDNENVYLGESAGKSLETLVHELMHTLTIRGLDSNYQNLYDESFSNEISEIYKTAKEKIRLDYGLKNEQELIAESFANPVFMAKLASIKTQKKNGKSSNLFSDLIESIRNFLNSFLKIDTTSSLLEDITNSVSSYLKRKEDIFSKDVIPLEDYVEEVTKINDKYDAEIEALKQPEKIDEIVEDILANPEQTDKDFAIKMLKDAIEYESNNEFGNAQLAQEYTDVLNRLENGEINVNEIGSVFNRPTTGENQLPTRTGTESISTENADIIQVSQSYQDIIRQEEERVTSIEKEIEDVSKEISDLERPFKFSETSEYKEFSKLVNIPEDKRTPEQQSRLDELRADINDWIMIMGTETQGINFADVVEQMVALNNVDTYIIPDTVEVTPEDIEENIRTVNSANRQNLRVGLNFNAVTSTVKKDGEGVTYTEIANMTITGLEDVSGVILEGEDGVKMNPVTNAIQLNDIMVSKINSSGKIYISTTDEGLSTYSSPVRQATLSLNGDVNFSILKTDFYEEYAPEEIDDATIYEAKTGEEVFIAVDPFDPYNKNLLNSVSKELGIINEQELEIAVEEELKLYKTAQLTKAQKKLRDLQNATKKDRNKISKQEELIQELIDAQRERLRNKLTGKRKTKLSDALSKELRSKLKLMVVNKDGENLNVLKGNRDVKDIEKLDAVKLQAVRDIFANDMEFLTKMIETPSLDIASVGLKVGRVLPGFPNYYTTVNTNGTLVKQSKTITQVEMNKIHDVGYLENGKILTRFGITDVDTTFVSRQMSSKSAGKIPLIIIKKGNQNIAYPISIISETPPVTADEMRSIKNSALSEIEKAIRLNELLAKAGVNTQEEGNAFIVVSGEPISTEFFEDKVAQVESINYLRSVDDFLDERISKEELLVGNASVNINLSEPFISPKLRLDFSNVEVKEVSNENLREKSKKTVSGVMSQLAIDRQKICK